MPIKSQRIVNVVKMSPAVTRDAVRGVSWWNHANQPLQDNQTVRVEISSRETFQAWEGFGGAVSELGVQALNRLPSRLRKRFFASVFGPNGANLSWIRLPVGASDFALSAYSFSETADDYALARFSIARDRQGVIPYLLAAALLSWAYGAVGGALAFTLRAVVDAVLHFMAARRLVEGRIFETPEQALRYGGALVILCAPLVEIGRAHV